MGSPPEGMGPTSPTVQPGLDEISIEPNYCSRKSHKRQRSRTAVSGVLCRDNVAEKAYPLHPTPLVIPNKRKIDTIISLPMFAATTAAFLHVFGRQCLPTKSTTDSVGPLGTTTVCSRKWRHTQFLRCLLHSFST